MVLGFGVFLYLAFILGLLFSGLSWGEWAILGLGISLGVMRVLLPLPMLRRGPSFMVWVLLGIVGMLACYYLQFRMPQPSSTDIGQVATQIIAKANAPQSSAPIMTVQGQVESLPRATRGGNRQIWLTAQNLTAPNPNSPSTQAVTGRVYVTLAPKLSESLHPGQTVTIEGRLYQPKLAANPAGFDFSTWLARQGCFSGMRGDRISILSDPNTRGLWQLRQRIVAAQQTWLKGPEGPLLGAMVLGNQAVDLPFEVQDGFIQAGLAHALAASGFQVSILLTMVLWLTQGANRSVKLGVGAIALLGFGALSGFEPSVSRAVLMGLSGLVALVLGQKMKPVPMLILIAFVMLVVQPLWIWHLGFQLSFLATLGLIVTVPVLQKRLDWLPPVIAAAIAVPIAASLWTLPLQLQTFGVLPVYGVLANVVTMPLLALITLGGVFSAAAGVIWPMAGGAIAWLMWLPSKLLLLIVNWTNQLPGQTWAVGSISVWQVVLLYGILVGLWLWPWCQRHWRLAVILGTVSVILPIWAAQGNATQLIVFEAGRNPIMVIQQPQSTILINAGDSQTCRRTLIPFLQHQGINRVSLAVATDLSSDAQQMGWATMVERMTLEQFSPVTTAPLDPLQKQLLTLNRKMRWQPLQPQESSRQGRAEVFVWRNNPALLEFKFDRLRGLMINNAEDPGLATWLAGQSLSPVQVVWLTGSAWAPEVLQQLNPEVVFVSNPKASAEAIAQLEIQVQKVYWTARDGAIQWFPHQGFKAMLGPDEAQARLL
jgi:competence protein ComEC